MAKKIAKNGFTLIETIIYLALFAIIIGGGMVATWHIIEATAAAQNHIMLQEEANFLLRKLNWALTGLPNQTSVAIPSPAIPYSDTTLRLTKNGVLLTFALTDNILTLQYGSGPVLPLTISSIIISATPSTHVFERHIEPGKPDAVTVNFTLTTAQNGRPATQDFSITKYLRQ